MIREVRCGSAWSERQVELPKERHPSEKSCRAWRNKDFETDLLLSLR